MINKKYFVSLVALLLVACANVPVVTPYAPQPTYGPIANGIMAEAGATSAAATGQAFIATGQAAQAIAVQATADYRATQDELARVQTQSAINERANVATATAVAQSGQATHAAAQTSTADANAQLEMQQAISATGTALYWDAQVVDAQAQADIMQARSDTELNQSVNDTIGGGVLVVSILIGLAVLVVAAAAVYFLILSINDKREIDREAYQEKKSAEIDEARARAAESWARVLRESIIERNGHEYMLTRRGLVPMLPAPEPFSVDPNLKLESEWRAVASVYVQSATELGLTGEEQYPFSEPSAFRHSLIQHPDTRKFWREGYRRVIGWLVDAKIMAKTGDGGKTDWAGGWSLERFEREFSHTALPEVPYGPVPVAKLLGRGREVGEVEQGREVVR